MVLAAPLFLVAQTRAFAHFYQLNREPLLRMGLGVLAAWMGLRAISKSYEASKLAEEVELQAAKMQTIRACVADEKLLHTILEDTLNSAASSPTTEPASRGWLSSTPSPTPSITLSPLMASILSQELLRRADEAAREVEVVARATGRIAPLGSAPPSTRAPVGDQAGAGQGGQEDEGKHGLFARLRERSKMQDLPLPHTDRIAAARAKAREMIEGGGALSSRASAAEAAVAPTTATTTSTAVTPRSAGTSVDAAGKSAPPNVLTQNVSLKAEQASTNAPRRFV